MHMRTNSKDSDVRRIFNQVLNGLRQSLAPLVTFEILAKTLDLALLGPLTAWALAVFLATTGDPTVSDEQIAVFILSPIGIIGILVVGTLTLLSTFIQQAGLMVIASASFDGGRISALSSLRKVFARGRDLFLLALMTIGLAFAVLAPCAAVAGVAYLTFLGDYDFNYYLSARPPEFWRAVVVGAIGTIALLFGWATLYLRLLFALPACVLSGLRPLRALKASWQGTRGRVLAVAKALVAWLVLMTLLGWAVGFMLQVVEKTAIGLAGEQLSILLPTLAALVVLDTLVFVTVTFVGVTTNALLVVQLYRNTTEAHPDLQPTAPVETAHSKEHPFLLQRWRVIQVAATAFLIVSGVVTGILVEQIEIDDRTTVTAHRGGSNVAPENSLSAIEAAIRQGADMAEIDVQETADGVVVLLHDSDLKRITGRNLKIWETSYDRIRSLDAGSWFAPEFKGERIPTLQEAIDAARGRIHLNIDLKFNGHAKKLVERVVDIIRENDFHAQCVISSRNRDAVLRVKRLDERLHVGHIVAASLGKLTRADIDFLSIEQRKATWTQVRSLHRAGREVHVWTVNDPRRMADLIDLGIDSIITDDAAALRAVRDARAEMSTTERMLLGARSWLAQ